MSLAFARKTSERSVLTTHSHVRVLVHIWGSERVAYLRAFPPLIIRRRETSQLVNVAKIIISRSQRGSSSSPLSLQLSLSLSLTLLFAEERFIISPGLEKLSRRLLQLYVHAGAFQRADFTTFSLPRKISNECKIKIKGATHAI